MILLKSALYRVDFIKSASNIWTYCYWGVELVWFLFGHVFGTSRYLQDLIERYFGVKDLKYYLRLPCIWQGLWGPRLFYIHRFVYTHFYMWLLRPWDICRLKLFIIIRVETLTFLLPGYETDEDVLVGVVEVLVDLVTGYRRDTSGITGGSVEGDFSF